MNGVAYALKEFPLRGPGEKAMFMNELKKLRALRHPCVVDMQLAFVSTTRAHGVDSTIGFIQLPFYEDGDLARWLVTEERIRSARSVLFLFFFGA